MIFNQVTLSDQLVETDVVVVIDVCRAFTTAAFAFSAGVEKIYLVDTVEAAFEMRKRNPHWLVAGEVGGLPVEGFDYWNSPYEFSSLDLSGRTLVLRTSSGTQGIIRYQSTKNLFAGSFVVARETVKQIQSLRADSVVFVVTGVKPGISGQEDIACAEYMQALLEGKDALPAPYIELCHSWDPRHLATSEAMLLHLQRDFQLCIDANRFQFCMRVQNQNGNLVLNSPVNNTGQSHLN